MDSVGTTQTGSAGFEPREHRVEPEFQEPAPRPMPGFVYEGRYMRRQKWIQRWLLALSLVCLAAQFVPALQQLSYYVLPLGYVGWIAVALILAFLWSLVSVIRGAGPLRYLTHGEAAGAQITELVVGPTILVNGSAAHYAYVATVLLTHPETGEILSASVPSDNFSASRKDCYETTLKVGDWVTVVYLPGRFGSSLKLYGFLGLNPDVDFLRIKEKARTLVEVAGAAIIVLFFAGLIMALITIERYEPLRFPLTAPVIGTVAVGALAGIAGLVLGYLNERKNARNRDARNAEAAATGQAVELGVVAEGRMAKLTGMFYTLCLIAGAPLLCGMVSGCGLFFANGFLDYADPSRVPVRLGERFTETHSLLFRQYKVKYTLEGEQKERELSTTPAALYQLLVTDEGVALVKPGFMGWPWVEAILPAGIKTAATDPGDS